MKEKLEKELKRLEESFKKLAEKEIEIKYEKLRMQGEYRAIKRHVILLTEEEKKESKEKDESQKPNAKK